MIEISELGPELPHIHPTAEFASRVMDRISELEACQAEGAAQTRALRMLWSLTGLTSTFGALFLSFSVKGCMLLLPRLGEAFALAATMTQAQIWLPAALVAAGIALAGPVLYHPLLRVPNTAPQRQAGMK